MNLFKYFCLILLSFTLSGCVIKHDATMAPGQTIDKMEHIYVEHFSPDKRNLHYLIADQLAMLGYPASVVKEGQIPSDADIIVTYTDNWMWDMSMYLLKIKIDFRSPNKQLLVSGETTRTSLARKPPEEMIKETLEQIFQEARIKYTHAD